MTLTIKNQSNATFWIRSQLATKKSKLLLFSGKEVTIIPQLGTRYADHSSCYLFKIARAVRTRVSALPDQGSSFVDARFQLDRSATSCVITLTGRLVAPLSDKTDEERKIGVKCQFFRDRLSKSRL